jgi:hypothetical protein
LYANQSADIGVEFGIGSYSANEIFKDEGSGNVLLSPRGYYDLTRQVSIPLNLRVYVLSFKNYGLQLGWENQILELKEDYRAANLLKWDVIRNDIQIDALAGQHFELVDDLSLYAYGILGFSYTFFSEDVSEGMTGPWTDDTGFYQNTSGLTFGAGTTLRAKEFLSLSLQMGIRIKDFDIPKEYTALGYSDDERRADEYWFRLTFGVFRKDGLKF